MTGYRDVQVSFLSSAGMLDRTGCAEGAAVVAAGDGAWGTVAHRVNPRSTGDGIAFVHAGGTIVKRQLGPGERLRLDTGCLVAFQPSVSYDIAAAGGIKTSLFGGEGIFLASLTGPEAVWIQSLPFSRLASRIAGVFSAGKGKGEGSLLGGLGNLFERR